MITPTKEQIKEWKQRIDDDQTGKLLMDGVEWTDGEQKIIGSSSDERMVYIIALRACRVFLTGNTPSSDEVEAMHDSLSEVRDAYAEHRATEDINEDMEASVDAYNNGVEFRSRQYLDERRF